MDETYATLSLEEARAIARRAVEKAEDLGLHGTFVVVDDGGIVVTASRMDGTGSLSYPVSRAKAYGAAVQREPSAAFAQRFSQGYPGVFSALVAMVDHHADLIHIDRMDEAAPMAPDAAEALAATAVNFRAPSATAVKYPNLQALASVTSFKYLPVAGGLPLMQSSRVTGAIGVAGADPEECERIARAAIGS